MTRTFRHEFDPPWANPIAGQSDVELTVQEIEDAGLREVLQTPGAPYSSWTILDALLEPTGDGSPFVFSEPLGAAREVKVALSGLFGRFVARAYFERYFNLRIFAHVRKPTVVLDGRRSIEIVSLERGDLPDWVACTSAFSDLTVAEAKGSHDPSGPGPALERAWKQAGRIDVKEGGHRVTLRRLAIATRWGMSTDGPKEPRIAVRDPIDKGDPIEPDDEGAIFAGLVRHHVANMLAPLGHAELAVSLRRLASAGSESEEWQRQEIRRVDSLLQHADRPPTMDDHPVSEIGGLVGGIVTRGGPLHPARTTRTDHEALARLNLRPVFVGIEREVVRAAAVGDPPTIRKALIESQAVEPRSRRGTGASGWICPLDE